MSNEIQRHIFLFTKSETEKSAIQYTTYSQSHTHISTRLMQFLSQEAFIHLQLFFFLHKTTIDGQGSVSKLYVLRINEVLLNE